jgi:hypothetical protein
MSSRPIIVAVVAISAALVVPVTATAGRTRVRSSLRLLGQPSDETTQVTSKSTRGANRMRKAAVVALFAVLLLVCAATSGTAATARAKTAICGQIKNGPKATYTSLVLKKKLSGNTWTVFATGVPCAKAMSAAPAILKWWGKAKVDDHVSIRGFSCNKESDGRGSSGSTGCIFSGLNNIELIMTGPYSIADLKRMFYIK